MGINISQIVNYKISLFYQFFKIQIFKLDIYLPDTKFKSGILEYYK